MLHKVCEHNILLRFCLFNSTRYLITLVVSVIPELGHVASFLILRINRLMSKVRIALTNFQKGFVPKLGHLKTLLIYYRILTIVCKLSLRVDFSILNAAKFLLLDLGIEAFSVEFLLGLLLPALEVELLRTLGGVLLVGVGWLEEVGLLGGRERAAAWLVVEEPELAEREFSLEEQLEFALDDLLELLHVLLASYDCVAQQVGLHFCVQQLLQRRFARPDQPALTL